MKILIFGAGQAGVSAAKKCIQTMPGAEVLIFDGDTHGLYAKMRLPEYLAGKLPAEKLILMSETAMREFGMEPHLGETVEEVFPERKQIRSSAGKVYSYDKLIFASGAKAFVPPVDGVASVEALTLRTLSDADRILEKSGTSRNAVVIGGGLLGLEAAWALKERGLDVTVIECMDRLLPRQLDEVESAVLLEKLNGTGLNFKIGVCVSRLEPGSAPGTAAVTVSDGSVIETGLLLFSAGIRSEIPVAVKCGLKINRGILVDDRFQTSCPDIYAVGDCAELEGRTWGLWIAAKDQAEALAEILAGTRESFRSPVYAPNLKISGIQLKEICSEAESRRRNSPKDGV